MRIELFILISVLTMLALMLLRRKRYGVSIVKMIVTLLYLAVMGMLSTRLLYFIENGGWQGRSFFGAVLFLPIVMFPLAKIMSIRYSQMMDFVSLPGLSMFAVMKFNCFVQGCCGGIPVGDTYFPIQIVETVVTILIVVLLGVVEKSNKAKDSLYPLSMLVYGIVRFGLNWLRWDASAKIFGLPKGNFWAIICIAIAIVWLLLCEYFKVKKEEAEICR